MKALLFNPVPAVCLRWKPLATLALSLSAAWPAWTAAPFTINGNGTVTDAVTSLVWDQCIVGRTGSDCATDDAVLSRLYTWPAALAAATAANAANYKGFNDWRLPNVKELESITKLDTWTSGQAAIDADAFPNTPISGDDWGGGATWTSTTFTPYPDDAWVVYFNYGYTPSPTTRPTPAMFASCEADSLWLLLICSAHRPTPRHRSLPPAPASAAALRKRASG